jgi:hypothetical protein
MLKGRKREEKKKPEFNCTTKMSKGKGKGEGEKVNQLGPVNWEQDAKQNTCRGGARFLMTILN